MVALENRTLRAELHASQSREHALLQLLTSGGTAQSLEAELSAQVHALRDERDRAVAKLVELGLAR